MQAGGVSYYMFGIGKKFGITMYILRKALVDKKINYEKQRYEGKTSKYLG